jgi:hypothetical protein
MAEELRCGWDAQSVPSAFDEMIRRSSKYQPEFTVRVRG